MLRIIILSALNIFLTWSGAFTQVYGPNPVLNAQSFDTLNNSKDTAIVKNGFLSLFKGKPGKAALLALLIPSAGQIYNKKWWKVPIALSLDVGLTYVLVSSRSNYNIWQSRYIEALNANPRPSTISLLKENRDFYRKRSEYAWIWIIAGHLLTVVDAYVDRHLLDFNVSDDLTTIREYLKYDLPLMAKAGVRINLNLREKRLPNPEYFAKP
jgi:hypothetical protein